MTCFPNWTWLVPSKIFVTKSDNLASFRAWAAAVARYEVLNYRKQQARDARLTFSDELEYQIASEVGELHDDLLDRHVALRECLQELKAGNRELLLSRYNSVETLAELASRVGRSVGGITDSSSTSAVVIGPSEFHDLRQQQQKQRLAHWTESRAKTGADPRALAYYQFQSDCPQSRQIDNMAGGASHPGSDGSVVVASRTIDRWGRSDAALDFSRVGSRVRINVPGEHRGLTRYGKPSIAAKRAHARLPKMA